MTDTTTDPTEAGVTAAFAEMTRRFGALAQITREDARALVDAAITDMQAESERQAHEIRRLQNNEVNDCDLLGVHEREIDRLRTLNAKLEAEIERLRERLGPRGLVVAMIDGAGHYVNETVAAELDHLRVALTDLVADFVNPGDGGPFEDGEVPALDRARAILGGTETQQLAPDDSDAEIEQLRGRMVTTWGPAERAEVARRAVSGEEGR
jgi:hypothetical protein